MLSATRQYFASKFSSDSLLANADFRLYWLSAILTNFGNQIGGLALPLCALLMHATPSQMGVLTACQTLPFAILALPSGVWLDRSLKFPILLGSKIVLACALATIPVCWWLDALTVQWLYLVGAVLGCCSVVGGGAEQVYLTSLVGRRNLVDAQSKFAASDSVSKLIAPGIAGILIQWLTAPIAMVANALTFVLSIWNLKKVRAREAAPEPSAQHPLHDMRDGIRFVWRQPLLRALAGGTAVWQLLYSGYMALLILFATRELHMSPGTLGTAQMLGGIGIFASSMMLKPLNRRFGLGKAMLIGMSATALGFVLMPLIPAKLFGSSAGSAVAFAVLVFFFDCGVMLYFLPYLALRQSVTPDELLGRMISTMRFLTIAPAPLGALSAGYIAEHYGVRTGLACIAVGGVLLTVTMLMSRQIRSVRP